MPNADQPELMPRSNVRLRDFLPMRTELRYLLVCCLALIACVAIVRPFAASGFDDDWSYSHVALRLAQTGRFHYNGWGSPTILLQSSWAALWIRIFGFSFNLLRAVTFPFSLAFVLLTYALGRKAGLRQNFALFAALIVATSPLFIPLAFSFMTEPYACSLTLLCVYAALSSADAPDANRATKWLWVLALSGILGGSDRQTVWAAPLVLIPFLFWKRRADRAFRVHAVIAFTACLIASGLVTACFTPRYAPLELSRQELLVILRGHLVRAPFKVLSVVSVAVLLSWPAFLCAQKLWKQIGVWPLAVLGAASAIAVVCLKGKSSGLVPFLGNILTPYGILAAGIDGLGLKPLLIPATVQYGLTFLLLLVVAGWGYLIWRRRLPINFPRTTATVFLLFSCAYLSLLAPGALTGFIYDRYALPLLPLLLVAVLFTIQFMVKQVPVTAWISLSILATYGIITSHDYFAALRARVTAADELIGRGVLSNRLSVGLEHDGWTQLQLAGKINPVLFGDDFDQNGKYWFWRYATAIQPEYVAVSSKREDHPKKVLVQVPYTAWTPPFERQICIMSRKDVPGVAYVK